MKKVGEPRLWKATAPCDLLWAEFDGEYVVYHLPSGKTHFVNSATAMLIRQVLTVPLDAVAAAEDLAQRENATVEASFLSSVAASLEQLEHLGLVRRFDR
jgi:PqqD family protein of HPr-rel-A system